MKDFLVVSPADGGSDRLVLVVQATDADKAVEAVRHAVCKMTLSEAYFREWALGSSANASFMAYFWLQTDEEEDHFEETGEVLVSEDQVYARIRAYFESSPSYGEALIAYHSKGDDSLITDDLLMSVADKYIEPASAFYVCEVAGIARLKVRDGVLIGERRTEQVVLGGVH